MRRLSDLAPAERRLGDLARQLEKTVSVAESCTGGRVGDRITDVPGSSDYFLGSAVTYSNEAKSAVLGVSEESLRSFGAVSEQVAKEMAVGARRLFGSDIAVSTTGIAGPTGGSPRKPVGLVWFCVSDGTDHVTDRQTFPGDRIQIKESASVHAIELLISFMRGMDER